MADRTLVLIVDDETKVRRLVAASLEEAGFDTVSASDGEQAIEVFMKTTPRPEIVVLDIMMPGIDGLECAKRLRKIEDVPILFLSAKNDPSFKLGAFEMGADDYITKPFPIEELIARVRAVFRRTRRHDVENLADEDILNGPMSINLQKRSLWVGDVQVHLADSEFRLVYELMRHPGAVLAHERLLRSVWGEESIDQLQKLRVSFARIRRKLEEAGIEGGIISSYSKVGYILRDLQKDPL